MATKEEYAAWPEATLKDAATNYPDQLAADLVAAFPGITEDDACDREACIGEIIVGDG